MAGHPAHLLKEAVRHGITYDAFGHELGGRLAWIQILSGLETKLFKLAIVPQRLRKAANRIRTKRGK